MFHGIRVSGKAAEEGNNTTEAGCSKAPSIILGIVVGVDALVAIAWFWLVIYLTR